MNKDAYYFPHDSNAKDDPKCSLLIEQLGLEGYGIFWVLVETLRDQPGYKYPLQMLPIIARKYNTTHEKIKAVVHGYNLFKVEDDQFFYTPALSIRMEPLERRRENARQAGIISAKKRAKALKSHVQPPLNDRSTTVQQSKVDENKTDKNKLNQNILEESNPDLFSEENSFPPSNLDYSGIDFNTLQKWFNANCNKMPQIKAMDEKRKSAVRSRVKEYGREKVTEAIRSAAQSKFLNGQNDKNWIANFDWIFRPTNFIKILEGNYDDRSAELDADRKKRILDSISADDF